MTPPETVHVELSREMAEALLDPTGAYRESMVLQEADDALRAALDQPAEERTEEFRVLLTGNVAGGRDETLECGSASEAHERAAYCRGAYRGIRAQRSFVTKSRTPWEDIDDEQ